MSDFSKFQMTVNAAAQVPKITVELPAIHHTIDKKVQLGQRCSLP
jgi:hypothetical protein